MICPSDNQILINSPDKPILRLSGLNFLYINKLRNDWDKRTKLLYILYEVVKHYIKNCNDF